MEWFSKNKLWLAGTGFFIISTTLRFLAVNQTEHPSGWDGYYYVMQVHSWLTYGYLQSPDFSFIYPYFAAITIIVDDPIFGFKVGVAIIGGMLVAATFYSLLKSGADFKWICVACSYFIFSPLITYFILQFPKNALGMVFLILFIASLPRKIPSIIFLIAAIMTHRMTGSFAIFVGLAYAIRVIPWKWILTGLIALAAISLLPGIIHLSDLLRFEGQFTLMPHWAPFAFARIFPNTLSILFKSELILISLLVVVLIIRWRAIYKSPWLVIALISVFPFFSFGAGDVGHRFFLIAPIAFVMLVPVTGIPYRLTWIIVSVFLVLSWLSWRSYKPRGFDPPNKAYSKVIERLRDRYEQEEYPLVIAHQSLAEMIIFETDFDALNWLPPKDMPPQHVVRLIKGLQFADFRRYLDSDDMRQVKPMASRYFATQEDVWQRFVQKVSEEDDRKLMKRIYSDFNPMSERPYFINKGKIR